MYILYIPTLSWDIMLPRVIYCNTCVFHPCASSSVTEGVSRKARIDRQYETSINKRTLVNAQLFGCSRFDSFFFFFILSVDGGPISPISLRGFRHYLCPSTLLRLPLVSVTTYYSHAK